MNAINSISCQPLQPKHQLAFRGSAERYANDDYDYDEYESSNPTDKKQPKLGEAVAKTIENSNVAKTTLKIFGIIATATGAAAATGYGVNKVLKLINKNPQLFGTISNQFVKSTDNLYSKLSKIAGNVADDAGDAVKKGKVLSRIKKGAAKAGMKVLDGANGVMKKSARSKLSDILSDSMTNIDDLRRSIFSSKFEKAAYEKHGILSNILAGSEENSKKFLNVLKEQGLNLDEVAKKSAKSVDDFKDMLVKGEYDDFVNLIFTKSDDFSKATLTRNNMSDVIEICKKLGYSFEELDKKGLTKGDSLIYLDKFKKEINVSKTEGAITTTVATGAAIKGGGDAANDEDGDGNSDVLQKITGMIENFLGSDYSSKIDN